MWFLLRTSPRFLFFGILASLFSGPGQPYLISLFTPYIREHLNISLATISSCFGAATVVASFLLPFLGKRIDDHHPLQVVTGVVMGILIGLLLLAWAPHVMVVFLGYFLVRAFAQGALGLLYTTLITRLFGRHRGKALSLANIGHSLGQSLLPLLISFFVLHLGWRWGLWGTAILLVGIFLPIAFLLLRAQDTQQPLYGEHHPNISAPAIAAIDGGTAFATAPVSTATTFSQQVFSLKDMRFWWLNIANVLTPLILTGIFFQQATLLQVKHWGANIYAQGLSFYAISSFFSGLGIGHLIDRFTARRITPYTLLPVLLGLFALYWGEKEWCWYLFMILVGMGPATGGTVKNALWAEMYGVNNLGSIRGVDSQINIISTSLGPLLFGVLFDLGLSPKKLLMGPIILVLVGILIHSVVILTIEPVRIGRPA